MPRKCQQGAPIELLSTALAKYGCESNLYLIWINLCGDEQVFLRIIFRSCFLINKKIYADFVLNLFKPFL